MKKLYVQIIKFKKKYHHAAWYKMLKFGYYLIRFPFDATKAYFLVKSGRAKEDRYRHTKSSLMKNTNKDKTIYMIRITPRLGGGFFYLFSVVLSNLIISEKRGLVPVVDMENYRNPYSENVPINGSYNVWEYFFEQPSGLSLIEAYRSENIVLSNLEVPNVINVFSADYLNDTEQVEKIHALITKYIKFKPAVSDYINSSWEKIKKSSDILGIYTRGTDYTKLKPFGHPVQPPVEFMINKAKNIMNQKGIEYCFLSTDEKSVLDKFISEFGNKVLYTDRLYYDEMDSKSYITEYKHNRETPQYWSAIEYMRDVVILSRCDYFLSAMSSGSGIAIEMNGNAYKEKYIIDLGLY